MPYLLMVLLILTAIFLIILVLIQRGKGGGLAGAFGGMGGQSAFGTKAGDLFTRITIGVAAVWILLCIVSVRLMGTSRDVLNVGEGNLPVQQAPVQGPGQQPPATQGQQPAAQNQTPAPQGQSPASSPEKPAQETPSTPSNTAK